MGGPFDVLTRTNKEYMHIATSNTRKLRKPYRAEI